MEGYLIAAAFLVVFAVMIGHWLWDKYRERKYCPKCGGELNADFMKYRHTVEWTCRDCHRSYEVLRSVE